MGKDGKDGKGKGASPKAKARTGWTVGPGDGEGGEGEDGEGGDDTEWKEEKKTFDRSAMKDTSSGLSFLQMMKGYKSVEEADKKEVEEEAKRKIKEEEEARKEEVK